MLSICGNHKCKRNKNFEERNFFLLEKCRTDFLKSAEKR